ncbi:MAG: hypothetical protein WD066_11545 [Planctomycetaceae bacterium]
MSARFAFEMFAYGVLAPALVAAVASCLARRVLPAATAARHAGAFAFSAGVCAGYALLPEWAPWIPERHWHWLPYLAIGAAVVGPIALAEGVGWFERWMLLVPLAIVASWLLVPRWPNLDPPRTTLVPAVAGYFFLLAVLLDGLPDRVPGRMLPGALFVSAAVVATVILDQASVSLARAAGLSACALGGIAAAFGRRATAMELRGLVPAFATIVGGMAFAGCIEPTEPLFALLLIPAAPLALWFLAWGPLRGSVTTRATLARGTLFVLALIVGAAAIYA